MKDKNSRIKVECLIPLVIYFFLLRKLLHLFIMQSLNNHGMKVETAKKFMIDKAPDSPMKGRNWGRELEFSHFQRRYRQKLSNSETFSLRFNPDSSLAAISFADGSL